MYKVTCNYGTEQVCWTLASALAWLSYCGTECTVINRLTGKVVAKRIQGS